MLLIFSIHFIVSLAAYLFYRYRNEWKYIERLPGPPLIPIVGNAHQIGLNQNSPRPLPIVGNSHQIGLNPKDYIINLMKWWRENNCGIYRIWIGPQPYVILTDPTDVEAVLTSNTLLEKGDIYDLLDEWIGKGLLTSRGSKWFKHRKMITPSFHFKILIDFLDTMNKNSNIFIKHLSEKAKTEEIFDFQNMTHYCTLDIICETAMGTEIKSMENHDSELVQAFQEMCIVVQNRGFSAWKRNPFLFKFSKEYKMQKKALGILKSFTYDVIKKRAELIGNQQNTKNENDDENVKRKQAFLDTLLTAQIDGRALTNYEIYEEVSTFMFEGHDTTTSGISYCTYLLSRHPEIQAKVFEEQKSIFNERFGESPTYKDIQDMKYLELVIKESQRLYPSVPLIARLTQEDVTINNKFIPAQTTLGVFILAMGYNEKYFKDPFKFNPERFNERDGKSPFEYVPFSAGPRNCIGQKFALMELKTIISNIVRNFEILPPTDECLKNGDYEKLGSTEYDPILASSLILKSANGIQIRLRQRNSIQ